MKDASHAGLVLILLPLQPYKYLQLTRLLEAGLTTRAQDYTRVLAQYVINTAATASSVEQSTFPNWVNNTLYLAEKLKYLVRCMHGLIFKGDFFVASQQFSAIIMEIMTDLAGPSLHHELGGNIRDWGPRVAGRVLQRRPLPLPAAVL